MPLFLMSRLMPNGVPSVTHLATSVSGSAAFVVQASRRSPWMGEVKVHFDFNCAFIFPFAPTAFRSSARHLSRAFSSKSQASVP